MEARCIADSPDSGLTLGRTYVVYGAYCAVDGSNSLLVNDGMPIWARLSSFEILDGRMPSSWRFVTYPEGERSVVGLDVMFAVGEGALVGTAIALRSLLEYEGQALAEFDALLRGSDCEPQSS